MNKNKINTKDTSLSGGGKKKTSSVKKDKEKGKVKENKTDKKQLNEKAVKETSTKKNSKKTSKKSKDVESIIDVDNENITPVSDNRELIINYDASKNKSSPIMNIYEYTLIIGKRATQIAHGAAPLIELGGLNNHIDIATEELRQKKTPYIVKRTFGNKTEYWKIKDLEIYE